MNARIVKCPWAFAALHDAEHNEKCTATIADTILIVEDDLVWLFTSKKGEVMRKRLVSVSGVRDRFCRLAQWLGAGGEREFICTLRYHNGDGELLAKESFSKLLAEWPPTSPNLVAIQCFVPGTAYRHSYSKKEDSDRVVTSTRMLPPMRPASYNEQKQADPDANPNGDVAACDISLSRASRLNETLDAATNSIVNFIERTKRVRVLSIDADYAVDTRCQLWLLWLGAATVLDMPNKLTSSFPRPGTLSEFVDNVVQAKNLDDDPSLEGAKLANGLAAPSALSHIKSKQGNMETDNETVQRNTSNRKIKKDRKIFPSLHECAGDYCTLVVHDPKSLFTRSELAVLSKHNAIPSNDSIRDATVQGSSQRVRNFVLISYKSVALARKEMRGLGRLQDVSTAEFEPEILLDTPQTLRILSATQEGERIDKLSTKMLERRAIPASTSSRGNSPHNKAAASRADMARQHTDKGGPAQYYRTVKVCENCFSVYTILDKARGVLINAKARRCVLSKDERRESTSLQRQSSSDTTGPSKENCSNRLDYSSGNASTCTASPFSSSKGVDEEDASTLTAKSTLSSNGFSIPNSTFARLEEQERKSTQYAQRPRVSWKSRIAESGLHHELDHSHVYSKEKEDKAAMNFEKLDKYLRGKSNAAARQVEVKKAALARSRAVQSRMASVAGRNVSSLYFGRVLVIDSEKSKELHNVVDILESAGFLVDVEFNARTARKILSDDFVASKASWQLDAVLVSNILDLGDAFEIVKDVRALESTHIERETKRVEEKIRLTALQPRKQSNNSMSKTVFSKHLPIVILTSNTSTEDLRNYKEAGMDGCISKPINRAALLSTMRAAVPQHGKPLNESPICTQRKSEHGVVGGATDKPSNEVVASPHQKQETCETSVCVSLKMCDHSISTKHGSAFDSLEFVREVSNQLDVGMSRIQVIGHDASVISFRICGFADDEAGHAFLRSLQTRTNLVSEDRWGRHELDDLSLVTTNDEVTHEGPSHSQALVAGTLGIAGTTSSSAVAAMSLSLPASFMAASGSVGGVLQLDADTSLPYVILDFSLDDQGIRQNNTRANTFNLVVCHDFFDTYERLKIVLSPIAAKYPGLQILLWNYPGQAFTEWREEQILNNVFMAHCLNELVTRVGSQGTRQFDDNCPFYLFGYGFGGSVSSFYATHYRSPNVRGIILFNGFSFVDPHLAGALHDAMNVFACAPPTRPDLPVYFWTRFLFSREYLMKVSTPLALNLYTAVHNPITLKGRMKLCVGGLSSHDVRPALKELGLPIIAVQSTEGVLVTPLHAQPWVDFANVNSCADSRNVAFPTIFQALKQRGTCIIWVKSGHEVFQEIRKQVTILLEQLLVGYHELNDVAFIPGEYADGKGQNDPGNESKQAGHGNFEDNFIDNVLGKFRATKQSAPSTSADDLCLRDPSGKESGAPQWSEFEAEITSKSKETGFDKKQHHSETRLKRRRGASSVVQQQSHICEVRAILDPDKPAFERQDNVVYTAGNGSRIYPKPAEYPEVKEYMGWRLRRNRKRLQRLDLAARIIQNAFRNHLSWLLFQRLRRERATCFIQRTWRGWKGRQMFSAQLHRVWAAHVIQRAWRGYAVRGFFLLLRSMHAAAGHIERLARGYLARRLAFRLRERRRKAATMVQTLVRRWFARIAAFAFRGQNLASRSIQRVFRGHLGRRHAQNERNKYLFSKSQSQGIEFGRQMLLEHKLHATRLQSEVSLLTQEKVQVEEEVEALLEEISEFEQGVNQLEKEMHQLSKIESEAVGVLDEGAKLELREQKMRLDREFGTMLAKIAERREKLSSLEGKLSTLDHSRQAKEEQLRTLERKLVLLLEEQQRELQKIKLRQQAQEKALTVATDAANGGAIVLADANAGNQGGGAYKGPTIKEKRQAAQLMQSTETLMKFGFMSMSMTYFSSLNMIKAMRTVAAQDTVMAALHANGTRMGAESLANSADADLKKMVSNTPYEEKSGSEPFQPELKPGQIPGQQPLRVSAWSVEDVGRWLQTLSLGQYREAFIDAAVDGELTYTYNTQICTPRFEFTSYAFCMDSADSLFVRPLLHFVHTFLLAPIVFYLHFNFDNVCAGAFLYDLDDDDLRNTLGIEHRLHRKKILNMTNKLKLAEYVVSLFSMHVNEESDIYRMERNKQMRIVASAGAGAVGVPIPLDNYMSPSLDASTAGSGQPQTGGAVEDAPLQSFPSVDEIFSFVRHGKVKKLKEALQPLPSRRFDASLVKAMYSVRLRVDSRIW